MDVEAAHRNAAWPHARDLAYGSARPRASASLPLVDALGTTLAADVTALTALPAFDTATMDGWGVSGDPPWRIVGEVLAGGSPGSLAPGEAVVIATGARLPVGAQAVVRREHASSDGTVVVPGPPAAWDPGRDVRRRGEEADEGDVLLTAGSAVTPPVLGLAAAAGHDRLTVYPRPTVDVLVLGDELLVHGPASHGKVRDALGPQIPGWVDAAGGVLTSVVRVADRLEATVDALRASRADLVVTTGGTARGPVDQVHPALSAVGARLLVDQVAVRPGHPMLLAALGDGRLLVGLPGNPLAAAVGFSSLATPALRGARGLPDEVLTVGRLTASLLAPPDAHRLVPVRVGRDGTTVTLSPLPHHGPAMLRGLTQADALAVAPPGGAREGDDVELVALPWR
jgi:molybdopterin molybdotransferase